MVRSLLMLLAAAAAAAGLDFSLDWAAFRAGGDTARVEFFYSIPYLQDDPLEFEPTGDTGLAAEFSLRFELGGENGLRRDATLYKCVTISSHTEATKAKRNFVDGFSVPLPAGRYWLKMILAKPILANPDADSVSFVPAGSLEIAVEVPDFGDGVVLSSLQLAAGFVMDTTTGAVQVVPNPTRGFGTQGLERVYFYLEGYNLTPGQDSFDVRTAVTPRGAPEDTLVSSSTTKPRSGPRVTAALGVSVATLAPGDYTLGVQVADRVGGLASRQADFRVLDTFGRIDPTPHQLAMTELERRYYQQLEYIATAKEIAYYESLSDPGQEAWLAVFWNRHNLSEFARRMESVKVRYATATTPGVRTDRGRVYVKYGEPDEVERLALEIHTRPREYWHYYGVGYHFIFIDLRGDGGYRLAFTNSPDEPPTGLENYLTPEEEEVYR